MERRSFIEAISAALATTLSAGRWAELSAASTYAASVPESAPYEFLSGDQARLLDVITAHIVPTDDTPGAREAHVVRFIDHSLATFFADHQKELTDVLAKFVEFTGRFRPDNTPFLRMSADEQVAALRDLERLDRDTFGLLREVTMLGMFCHPEHGGNYHKIGWKLIGYVDQYSWAPPFGYYDRA
jgi:hypothetical protein